MRSNITKLLLSLLLVMGVVLPAAPAWAAGAQIYVSAEQSRVVNGGTLIVAVYMNGGGSPINAVVANISYPAGELSYQGLSYSGGAFGISTPSNGGSNGLVSIQNGSVSPVSGSALVATITFRALVGSGSATIGVAGGSSLISATTNSSVPFSPGGVSVGFGEPVAAPPVSQPTTSNQTNSDQSTASNTAPASTPPPKNTTPPKITDIHVQNVTIDSATISWTTNEPTNSDVEYGLGTSYGLNVSTAALSLSHSLALSSAFLLPKIQLHYAIKSTDAAGNVEISPDQILNLPGIPVVILVRGVNGKPQAGATVTLDNDTATTNEKGSVTLSSGLGVMKVITTYQGVTVEKSITVGANTKPLTNYQLDLSSQPVDHWAATSLTLVAVIILLLGVDGALFGSRIVKRLLRLRTKPNAAQAALSDAEAPVVAAAVAVEPEQPDPALTDTIYDEEFVKDTAPAVTTAVTPDHTSDSEDTPPPQAEADDSRSTAPPVIVPPAEATPTYDVPPPPRADVMQIPVMEAEESQLVLKKAMPTKPRRKRAVAKKPRKRALPS